MVASQSRARIAYTRATMDLPGSPLPRGAHDSSARAALRDPLLVDRILERHAARPGLKPLLDVPCGTGQLRGVFERRGLRCVGVSLAMPTRDSGASQLVADVERLPFRDDAFDVVVCCRLLHHLHDPDEIQAVISELTRVAHRLVVASFWDSASLHALRRRVGLRRSGGPGARRAVSKRMLRALFRENGAEVVGFYHSFRFVSQQTFVVAQKRAPIEARLAATARITRDLLDLPLGRAPGSLGA